MKKIIFYIFILLFAQGLFSAQSKKTPNDVKEYKISKALVSSYSGVIIPLPLSISAAP